MRAPRRLPARAPPARPPGAAGRAVRRVLSSSKWPPGRAAHPPSLPGGAPRPSRLPGGDPARLLGLPSGDPFPPASCRLFRPGCSAGCLGPARVRALWARGGRQPAPAFPEEIVCCGLWWALTREACAPNAKGEAFVIGKTTAVKVSLLPSSNVRECEAAFERIIVSLLMCFTMFTPVARYLRHCTALHL